MPNPEDPCWTFPRVQLPPSNLVLRLQLSLEKEPARPAQAQGAPAMGLLGPELATPWEGITCPMRLWCNQQGSTCPCPDRVEHEIAPVIPLPPTQVQEGLSAYGLKPASNLLTWGSREPG